MHRTTITCLAIVSLAAGCAFEGEVEEDEMETYDEGEVPDLDEIEYATGNLLTNAGFESGVASYDSAGWGMTLGPWIGWMDGGGDIRPVNQPHSGARSIRIADARGRISIEQRVAGWAGVRYEASAWTRYRGGGCSQYLGVWYYKRGSNGLLTYLGRSGVAGTGSTSWTKVVIRFTPPAGTNRIGVIAGDSRSICGAGTHDWDDFSLREL